MHNLEDVIEKYRYELLEFSKHNGVHNTPNTDDEDLYENVIPVNTVPTADNSVTEERQLSANEPYADYDDFVRRNPSSGFLKVQVYAASAAFPVINAFVRVTVALADEERELFSGHTDMDGIIDDISLPAPNSNYSLDENSTVEPYAVYNITVTHPGFATGVYNNAPVFDSIKSIQPVGLVPLSDNGDNPGETIFFEQPMSLFGGEG